MAFHTIAAQHGGHAEYATATASTTSYIPANTSHEGKSLHCETLCQTHDVAWIDLLIIDRGCNLPVESFPSFSRTIDPIIHLTSLSIQPCCHDCRHSTIPCPSPPPTMDPG